MRQIEGCRRRRLDRPIFGWVRLCTKQAIKNAHRGRWCLSVQDYQAGQIKSDGRPLFDYDEIDSLLSGIEQPDQPGHRAALLAGPGEASPTHRTIQSQARRASQIKVS